MGGREGELARLAHSHGALSGVGGASTLLTPSAHVPTAVLVPGGRFAGGLCTSATGHNNPQFLVTVKRTTVAFFTLSQTGQSREEFHGIMAVLFPGSSPRRMPLTASETSSGSFYHTGAPSNQREVRGP